jgi:5'-nucleotidase
MGLIEYDWVITQNTIKPTDFEYEDFIKKGKELTSTLKAQGCNFIIALTHMRTYNDK